MRTTTRNFNLTNLYPTSGNLNIYGDVTLYKGDLIFKDPYIIRANENFSISSYTLDGNGNKIMTTGYNQDSGGNTYMNNVTLSLGSFFHLPTQDGTIGSIQKYITNEITTNVNGTNITITPKNVITSNLNADYGTVGGVTFVNNTMSFNGQLELFGNNTIVVTRNGVRATLEQQVANQIRVALANITEPIVTNNLTIVNGELSFGNQIYLVPSSNGLYIYTTPDIFGIFQGVDGKVGIGTNIPSALLDINGDVKSKGITNTGAFIV